jgi:hypothetical protein
MSSSTPAFYTAQKQALEIDMDLLGEVLAYLSADIWDCIAALFVNRFWRTTTEGCMCFWPFYGKLTGVCQAVAISLLSASFVPHIHKITQQGYLAGSPPTYLSQHGYSWLYPRQPAAPPAHPPHR